MPDNISKSSIKQGLAQLLYQYRHAWLFAYALIYIPWFSYLEKTVTTKFHIITLPVDSAIPFCEYFVIPYFMWFGYVFFTVLFFFFHDKAEYYKLCAFLFTGMTVFLIVSTLYPNGHYLRPSAFAHDNFCTHLVAWLYSSDTSTNLFPSIHVYNSLGVHLAITRSRHFQGKRITKTASFLLCTAIILATMFLKQHSVFDVMTAFFMAAFMYHFVYNHGFQRAALALRNSLTARKKQPDVIRD